jgi:putative exosortase-associated protein (TIGR04073 family)
MTVRKNGVQKSIALAMVLSLLFLVTGCIVLGGSSRAREEEQRVSLRGTGRELVRGAANVGLCWLEIPSEIEAHIRDHSPGNPFGIVSPVFGVTFGTISGSVRGVERAIGGIFEIGLSPFPPYEPLMDPAFPPYLKSIKPPCKKGCGCDGCASKDEEDADCDE